MMPPNQPSQQEDKNPAFGEKSTQPNLTMPAVSDGIAGGTALRAIAPRGQREAIALSEDFPESLPSFTFKLGDRVRWKPMPSTDWGTITGIEYSWHSPGNSWQPRYKVYLDSESPSRAWTDSDWAWEWDLESELEQQKHHSAECES
jgi:hypothetical protein